MNLRKPYFYSLVIIFSIGFAYANDAADMERMLRDMDRMIKQMEANPSLEPTMNNPMQHYLEKRVGNTRKDRKQVQNDLKKVIKKIKSDEFQKAVEKTTQRLPDYKP